MNDVISLKNFLNIGHYPKFYLKDRNGNFEFFAIGENGGISNFKIHLQGFNSNTDATWIKNIKTTIIPESVIIKNRDGTTFLGYPLPRTEGNNQQSVNTMIEEIGIVPDQTGYSELFSRVQSSIKSGILQKVVLARKHSFKITNSLDIVDLLNFFESNSKDCYIYCICLSPEQYCAGASPERLFKLDKQTIISEAIAGTATKGKEDELASIKNHHENNLVGKHIVERMQQFASNIQISKPFTISPSNVSHLKCEINGIIERQFDFEQLAEFIHPTPAMAGYPQIPSMDFLKQEPFARGLYSGLFGYELNSDKESIVLIRGIFVNKDKLDIYVGSGIVAGSSMADEWNELNNKEQMLLNYINQFKV